MPVLAGHDHMISKVLRHTGPDALRVRQQRSPERPEPGLLCGMVLCACDEVAMPLLEPAADDGTTHQ
jgi:hypothetical protein